MYLLYKHTAPNGKIYIGITGNDLKVRCNNGHNYKGCRHFENAINKYGWDNIKHEILIDGLTKEEAEAKEIEYIKKYDSANPKKGYNISLGGHIVGEETKKIMSENAKLRCDGKSFYIGKGEENPFYGKKHTEKTRKKLRELAKLKTGSKNPKAKKVICLETGKTYSYIGEASEDTGVARTDINCCCTGRHLTAGGYHWAYYEDGKDYSNTIDEIESQRGSKEIKVKCIETNEIFKSIKDAAKSINRNPTALSACLKGITNTCGGLHWTFI